MPRVAAVAAAGVVAAAVAECAAAVAVACAVEVVVECVEEEAGAPQAVALRRSAAVAAALVRTSAVRRRERALHLVLQQGRRDRAAEVDPVGAQLVPVAEAAASPAVAAGRVVAVVPAM